MGEGRKKKMSRILITKEEEKAEALHLETFLKKGDQDGKVWSKLEKPGVSGLANKCRKLKTWPEK